MTRAFLVESGFTAPTEATLLRYLDAMPAQERKIMRGINNQQVSF